MTPLFSSKLWQFATEEDCKILGKKGGAISYKFLYARHEVYQCVIKDIAVHLWRGKGKGKDLSEFET